ncbi:MAG: ribosome biogenesis GTP-binding protein YsxC [Parcubacteria group bacterium SW_6_46_9]|nr:MAG: ribosome biogenesis GTP-binding protein YsxC [Parcubacteria group bacterium SW_6_46_9]
MNAHQPKNTSCDIVPVSKAKAITGEDPILKKDTPHFVFAGRSNAGKSSVINALANKSIAPTSNTPGKTTQITMYEFTGGQGFLVDLPGYGYAKLSAKRVEKIRKQMIWYLARSEAPIAEVFLVIDIRRGLQGIDRDLLEITAGEGLPATVVANKTDKCNQSELVENCRMLDKQITELAGQQVDVLEVSARTGKGIDTLCTLITSHNAD